jgi:ferredoxin
MSEETRMRVQIDGDLCEGHGRCYVLSPSVFTADDEGNGEVLQAELSSDELIAAAELGAKNCPERAITLTPADGA